MSQPSPDLRPERREPAPQRFADKLWVTWPFAVASRTKTLGAVLLDGAYLRGTPLVDVLAPVAALAVGAFLAASRDPVGTPTYTASVPIMAALLLVASFGAALGLWATIGWALGDLFLARHAAYNGVRTFAPDTYLATRASWLLSWCVLAMLLVFVPLLASVARTAVANLLKDQPPAALVVSAFAAAAVAGVATYGWVQTSPLLIRPVFTWPLEEQPPVLAIDPVQKSGWVLMALAVVLAFGRTFLEATLRTHLPKVRATPPREPVETPMRTLLSAIGSGVFLTFLMSGLYPGYAIALLALIVFTGAAVLRSIVLPRVPPYCAAVGAIPLLVRMAVVVVITFLVGRFLVISAAENAEPTFTSVALTVFVAAVLSAFLMPKQPRRAAS